jgi:Mor family transcriptional regulator
MPKSSSISAEKIAEAESLYIKGSTLKEIMAKYGYSVSTWHKLLSRRVERVCKVSERDTEMLDAHEGGKSFGTLAAEYGITRQRAHQIVKRTKVRVDSGKRKAIVV